MMTDQKECNPLCEVPKELREAEKPFSKPYTSLGIFSKWTTTLAVGVILWMHDGDDAFTKPAVVADDGAISPKETD